MARIYIGDEVKKLRERAGLSQKEFAKALDVSYRSVQEWENGRDPVDVHKAASLLKAAEGMAKKAERAASRRAAK